MSDDLHRISTWPATEPGLLDFVCKAWNGHYGAVRPGEPVESYEGVLEPTVEIVTGGWGDNEAILAAFHENPLFGAFWCASFRGGRHVFRRPPWDKVPDKPSLFDGLAGAVQKEAAEARTRVSGYTQQKREDLEARARAKIAAHPLDPVEPVLREIVDLLIYQPDIPTDHKEALVKAFTEFRAAIGKPLRA